MTTEIKLKQTLTYQQECWLEDNVGPKLYYLHYKYGGKEWSVVREYEREYRQFNHYLKFTDDRMAVLYMLRWS